MGYDFTINLSNYNNLHLSEYVSCVSETQPQMGKNYKLNNFAVEYNKNIYIYILNELGRCCQITNITIMN